MENIFYIRNVLILLSMAIIIVAFFKAIKLSPVLGYFAAGIALGNYGMALINPGAGMAFFAELGIVFLLFVIGLELTFERLIAMKVYVFGAGSIQIIITVVVIAFFLNIAGYKPNTSAIVAGGLCLSSTAIVLQVLKENGSQLTKIGRLSVAMLLMQDFAVVPLLVLVPNLAHTTPEASIVSAVIITLIKATVGLVIIFISGRLLFRPMFNIIAHFESEELFIATTILIVLGSAYATEKVGLSMALGAFVAGLAVADTNYRHDVEKVVFPFKALLLGLFFMTVGMSLNITTLLDKIHLVTSIALGIIATKTIVIFFIAKLFKFNNKSALHAGLLLSQGGEFAFILFELSLKQGLLNPELAQTLMISVTITMALTPLLDFIGGRINTISTEDKKIGNLIKEEFEIDGHVAIIGFGKIAKVLADTLISEGVSCAILEINPELVVESKKAGYPIYYGSITDESALKKIDVKNAAATVLTIKNAITINKAISSIKQYAPKTKIIVRSKTMENMAEYKKLGIYFLMPYQYSEALMLCELVLKIYGRNETVINDLHTNFNIQDCSSSNELLT
ncbi:monovalent cation:H+ antiporter-2, CPA2 family [Candidatus Xenohaliotis californiensis]|uniref:Monovalent cation:H+ antiporter-2, CPA2 family n=1 Tax=Candidatus Xenohaliotis californiensis TaxID=84677 RepID=A0ABP0EUZ7_9RICK|nr:monovalent cation:H+ antiporter-2, CPA2 family [Candidatus Xenohaliotis californiensis]